MCHDALVPVAGFDHVAITVADVDATARVVPAGPRRRAAAPRPVADRGSCRSRSCRSVASRVERAPGRDAGGAARRRSHAGFRRPLLPVRRPGRRRSSRCSTPPASTGGRRPVSRAGVDRGDGHLGATSTIPTATCSSSLTLDGARDVDFAESAEQRDAARRGRRRRRGVRARVLPRAARTDGRTHELWEAIAAPGLPRGAPARGVRRRRRRHERAAIVCEELPPRTAARCS